MVGKWKITGFLLTAFVVGLLLSYNSLRAQSMAEWVDVNVVPQDIWTKVLILGDELVVDISDTQDREVEFDILEIPDAYSFEKRADGSLEIRYKPTVLGTSYVQFRHRLTKPYVNRWRMQTLGILVIDPEYATLRFLDGTVPDPNG